MPALTGMSGFIAQMVLHTGQAFQKNLENGMNKGEKNPALLNELQMLFLQQGARTLLSATCASISQSLHCTVFFF